MAGGNVSPQLAGLFKAAGAQYKIPPQVLAGIASVETNLGQNRNTSSTGAKGLMQFEPGTAASLGVNVNDPRSEIFGAAKLLTQYGYHTNPFRAIGAYNGGPGNPQSGYATQVLSEANRLKSELAGGQPAGGAGVNIGGGQSSMPWTQATTTNSFDRAGYNQAVREYQLGQFLHDSAGNDLGSLGDPKGTSSAVKGLSSGQSPLFASGLATLTKPNVSDYMTAHTRLQTIAGNTRLAQHPSIAGSAPAGGFKGYVNPIRGAIIGRTDMGVDASGLPNGHPIVAPGDSRVVQIYPNWYRQQPYVLFQFTSGPQAGRYYYIAEAINPTVRPGQAVRAGQQVGTFNAAGTGLELGWGTKGWQTLAQASGNTGDASHGNAPAGVDFRKFLSGLGK